MGILNLTPDSFYDGGKYRVKDPILRQTEKMLSEGATFIDLGGYSSRPGATNITEKEELSRLLPVVDLLQATFPGILLSIDTFRSEVANSCLQGGAALINDISAGTLDNQMIPVVAQHGVPYIMMHMRGTPQTMQDQTVYEDLMGDVLHYFSERVALARSYKINDIIIDPGIGFAKNISQNYELLKQLDIFQTLGLPVLLGVSRKSMIFKKLKTDAEHALNGTTALHMYALTKGANILRAHDIKEAVECIKLMGELS